MQTPMFDYLLACFIRAALIVILPCFAATSAANPSSKSLNNDTSLPPLQHPPIQTTFHSTLRLTHAEHTDNETNKARTLHYVTRLLIGQRKGDVTRFRNGRRDTGDKRNVCRSVCTVCERVGSSRQATLCRQQCVESPPDSSAFEYCLELWNQRSTREIGLADEADSLWDKAPRLVGRRQNGETTRHIYGKEDRTMPIHVTPREFGQARAANEVFDHTPYGSGQNNVREKLLRIIRRLIGQLGALKEFLGATVRQIDRLNVRESGDVRHIGRLNSRRELVDVKRREIGGTEAREELKDVKRRQIGGTEAREKLVRRLLIGLTDTTELVKYIIQLDAEQPDNEELLHKNVGKRNMCRSVCTLCDRLGSAGSAVRCQRDCVSAPSTSQAFKDCLGLWQLNKS